MEEKDNYATTSPLNEGAGATNTYIADSPLGNVKVYDLDTQIAPIQREPSASNSLTTSLPETTPAISEVTETTTTIAPITPKKPNYLVYGGGALAVGLVAYQILKKR